MNKIQAVVAVAFVALSTASFAQDSAEVARQHRMDAAYVAHRDGPANTVREDAHRAGHAIHNGARATGHAIHNGVRATGHAIHNGVRATGHAIHRGVDKLTGK